MRWVSTALLIAALTVASALRSVAAEGPCHASRLALVIGNAAYADSDVPLREPIGGAREFADALQRLGFATTEAENLTQDRMRSSIDAFEQKVTADAVALVFFAGFGIQSGGHTYLIPVDAAIWNEQDIKTVGFSLDRILSDLAEHGAHLRFVIVDGARRNPFERRFRPTGAQGMAAINGTSGVLALYSSLPGTTFDEGGGNTSPFVDALITAVSKPGAQAEEAFRRARADAARTFRGSQTPWVSSFLDEDVALDGGDCRAPHAATADTAPPVASSSSAPPPPSTTPTPPSPKPSPPLPVKVPARPVTPAPAVTAAEAPPPAPMQPPPAPRPSSPPPAEATALPAHVAEQTPVAVASPVPPPSPPAPSPSPPAQPIVSAASDSARQPLAAPVTSSSKPTPAVEAAPPAPPTQPSRPAEPETIDMSQRGAPPPPPPPQPASQPPPRQEVAIAVPPPPSVTDDAAGSEPVTDAGRLKEIKDRLYDRGLDPGEAGSPEMRNAILTYEKQVALPAAEQPTVRLLSSLRSSPVPTPWAAITVARDFKRWGMSWHEDTRRAALAGARARCGSDDCVAAVSFSGHHCGAFALSPSGWSITWRDDEARAREAALSICKQKGPTCEIIGAVCADGSGRSSAARTQQDNH